MKIRSPVKTNLTIKLRDNSISQLEACDEMQEDEPDERTLHEEDGENVGDVMNEDDDDPNG